MRIPFSKVHRAFPELDVFSDAECRTFVQLAQRERAVGLLGTAMGAVVASIGSGSFAAYVVWKSLKEWLGDPDLRPTNDVLFGILFVLTTFAGIFAAAFVGLLIRDFWIRWAISSRLRIARCGRCTYSLLGLSVIDDRVQCPECGDSTRLSDRGLTPADILAGARELILRDGVA